jgi:demethylmenaquinone methyltransferase/2-methoxy-6-polyprenyl-1,4-benzoquinol methylase
MSAPDASQLASYYAARAAEYESIYDKPERQADLAKLRTMVPAYFAGRRVLEIACGTGYWTQHIAASASGVTATDVNAETLDIARSKRYPPGRVSFGIADVWRLPPSYRGYTGAFAGFWWSHVRRAERRTFVEALHRALGPGAVVVALDNRYVEGSSTPIAHVDEAGDAFQRRRLRDGSEHLVLKNFPTRAELTGDLSGVSAAVEYVELEYYWVLKYEVAR